MSWILSNAVRYCKIGNKTAKAVLRSLCDYAQDDGSSCFPTLETIANELEINYKTIFPAKDFLIENKWIKEIDPTKFKNNGFLVEAKKIYSLSLQNGNNVLPDCYKGLLYTKNGIEINREIQNTIPKTEYSVSQKRNTNYTENGIQAIPKTEYKSVTNQSKNQSKNQKAGNNSQNPKKKKPAKNVMAKPSDVPDQLWNDYLKVCKDRRFTPTETSIAKFREEGQKINWTLEQVIRMCVTNSWSRFLSKWSSVQEAIGNKPVNHYQNNANGYSNNHPKPQNGLISTVWTKEQLQAQADQLARETQGCNSNALSHVLNNMEGQKQSHINGHSPKNQLNFQDSDTDLFNFDNFEDKSNA